MYPGRKVWPAAGTTRGEGVGKKERKGGREAGRLSVPCVSDHHPPFPRSPAPSPLLSSRGRGQRQSRSRLKHVSDWTLRNMAAATVLLVLAAAAAAAASLHAACLSVCLGPRSPALPARAFMSSQVWVWGVGVSAGCLPRILQRSSAIGSLVFTVLSADVCAVSPRVEATWESGRGRVVAVVELWPWV